MVQVKSFHVIGIKISTTNENGQSMQDIGGLWGRFMAEKIADSIPNRTDEEILSVYHHYQGDYTQPYDVLIGCRVATVDNIPEGLGSVTVDAGDYHEFLAKGDVAQGAVGQKWQEIWQTELNRAYQTDFEVYGEKAKNPHDAEVSIFVGSKI